MKQIITNNAEGVYIFTNHQVDMLEQTDGFNTNHLAKVLVGHIDTYKILVEHLIKEKEEYRKLLTEEIEYSRR